MDKSTRHVISEQEILAVQCPTCNRAAGKTCVAVRNRAPLSYEINVTECSFHAARIIAAQDEQIKRLGFGNVLGPTEKALILYYAYIMVCDSVASKSKEMFGKEMNTEEIQRFFAHKAVDELRHDELFKHGKAN